MLGCVVPEVQYYKREEYVETPQGTKFAHAAALIGASSITLGTRTIVEPDSIIRGDLAKVKVGKHCVIRRGAVIRPACKKIQGSMQFFPMTVGNHSYIGEDAVVEALKLGSCVYVGRRCVIGKRSIIGDCCYIQDGSLVPADAVIPAYSHLYGCPASSESLGEGFLYSMTQFNNDFFNFFLPELPQISAAAESSQSESERARERYDAV